MTLIIFFTTVGQKINNTFADQNLPWRGPSSIYSLTFEPISENDMMILLRNLTDKSNNDILGLTLNCKIAKDCFDNYMFLSY